MDPHISRSTAYQIRNRTTHSWGPEDPSGLSDSMTMSCPNARTLEEHMRSARAYVPRDPNPSPVVVKGKALVSPTSPHPGQRPASAYSYDGGFFLSAANAANKDYFVVHPDWVSESMTVHKLPLNERHGRALARTLTIASGHRSVGEEEGEGGKRSRRCKSAPPPKHRNPITWF